MKKINYAKRRKICKRCEGQAAGRDGYCTECRAELVKIGRETTLEGLRLTRDMSAHRGDRMAALDCAIKIDKLLGRY